MLAPREDLSVKSAFHTFLSLTSWWILLLSPRSLTLFSSTVRTDEKSYVKREHVNPTAFPTDRLLTVLRENFRHKRMPGWAVG